MWWRSCQAQTSPVWLIQFASSLGARLSVKVSGCLVRLFALGGAVMGSVDGGAFARTCSQPKLRLTLPIALTVSGQPSPGFVG
jgi:hypothetical protein